MLECPVCGSRRYFNIAESTKLKTIWRECLNCGYHVLREKDGKAVREDISCNGGCSVCSLDACPFEQED